MLEASTIIEILAETNNQELSKSAELSISYSIDTKNVILTDNIFQVWILDKYKYNLKKVK